KGAAERTVAPVLAAIVQGDPIAFVREAAIRSLGSFDPAAVREALSRAETSDPEPRLRELAKEMLQGSPH
ncbi:MAG TPA: HEAT repeat domain-containing protein, partial [Polyangiaceae bacterium]|nr:HEAT repeat domain-containing protein [Polyangiaceae bacterium]